MKLGSPRGISPIEHLSDAADCSAIVFDELGILVQIQSLEQDSEARKYEKLALVDAMGEAQIPFVKQLYELNDVFAGGCQCDDG